MNSSYGAIVTPGHLLQDALEFDLAAGFSALLTSATGMPLSADGFAVASATMAPGGSQPFAYQQVVTAVQAETSVSIIWQLYDRPADDPNAVLLTQVTSDPGAPASVTGEFVSAAGHTCWLTMNGGATGVVRVANHVKAAPHWTCTYTNPLVASLVVGEEIDDGAGSILEIVEVDLVNNRFKALDRTDKANTIDPVKGTTWTGATSGGTIEIVGLTVEAF